MIRIFDADEDLNTPEAWNALRHSIDVVDPSEHRTLTTLPALGALESLKAFLDWKEIPTTDIDFDLVDGFRLPRKFEYSARISRIDHFVQVIGRDPMHVGAVCLVCNGTEASLLAPWNTFFGTVRNVKGD